MQVGFFRFRHLQFLYEVNNHIGCFLVFLFQRDEAGHMFRHIREACVELAASTAYCFGIEADYFSVSYLRHAFKEAPVYFLCRSFRLVGVPKYDGKFGLLPESFPIIAYKRMYIHSLLFFTKDN